MTVNKEWPPVNDREFNFLRIALASKLFADVPFPDPPNDLDWEHLYFLLVCHRLTAHFYVLGKSKRNNWPPYFRERLRLDRYRQIIYGEKFSDQIGAVLATLINANIIVIVLKGWALIQTIYGGDLGQRIFDDIDILVHPRDVDVAEVVLRKLGWQAAGERRPGFTRRYYNAQAYFFQIQAENQSLVYTIGLHWGLLHHPAYNPDQIEVGMLFERAHSLQIAGVPVLEMDVQDHFVYSCAHITLQHRSQESLLRYYEIAAVIKNANSMIDWQKVAENAKCWKLVIPVITVVNGVEKLWPGTLPAQSLTSIQAIKPSLGERLIHSWYEKTNHNGDLEHFLTWLTMAGLIRRFSFIFEDIFPNPPYMRKYYGPNSGGFWPLLYFRRFFRVFGYLMKWKA